MADHAFALAAAVAFDPTRVDVGGVDQVEAIVDEGIEQVERRGLVGGPAEHVATEGERRDREAAAAEGTRLHANSLAAWMDRKGAW